jgi:hypothetical protein
VALPRATRTPKTTAPVTWHRFAPDTFELGREPLALDEHTQIGVYSAERCIVDAFRLRGTQGPELAHEALRRWLRRRDANPAALLRLAAHFPRTQAPIRIALELLL